MDSRRLPGDPEAVDAQLTDLWHDHRRYLLDLAFRMLGSIADAEDVVQEAFTRLLRVSLDEIDDVRGWLVVVVSRLCLDQLRSARSRREASLEPMLFEPVVGAEGDAVDPADRIVLDDSVRLALMVVLERLTPAERAAFVLHDVFQFSFEAVGSILGRSPAACRQLASRARRHIRQETGPARFEVDPAEQRRISEQFITACSDGDLERLIAVLHPDIAGDVVRGDLIERRPTVGPVRVANVLHRFYGPGSETTLASLPVNGEPGIIAFRERKVVAILVLRLRDGLVVHIQAIAEPRTLAFATSLLASRS